MTLDRKDYKSAIPQLESMLQQLEKVGRELTNKFEDIAHQTQLDAADAEKQAASIDYQLNTLQVHTEYALVADGFDPSPTTQWSETMPAIDGSTSGMTLWYRAVTYRNGIVVQRTNPQMVNLMDGVYTFINSVSSTDPTTGEKNWTTIDGGTITTGTISADRIAVDDIIIGQTQVRNLSSSLASAGQTASLFITRISNGITVHDAYDSSNLTRITSDGMEVIKNNVSIAQYGELSRAGAKDTYHTIVGGTGFYVNDADENAAFGVSATGQSRQRTIRATHIDEDNKLVSSSSKPTTVYTIATDYITLTKPNTTYSFIIHSDDGEQTIQASFTTSSLAGLNTLTASTRTVKSIWKKTTSTTSYFTSKWTFSVYSTRSDDDGYKQVKIKLVRNTSGWQQFSTSPSKWMCVAPPMDVTYIDEIDVANMVINGSEYNIETLFGTNTDALSLGSYISAGILSSSTGTLLFYIPTGRVFPADAVVERITFNILCRAGNSDGTGIYFIKASSGGYDVAPFDSSANSSFYNAGNMAKSLFSDEWSWSIQGGTNIRVKFTTGENYFFSGSSTTNDKINNQPTTVYLSNITLYLSFASKGEEDPDE